MADNPNVTRMCLNPNTQVHFDPINICKMTQPRALAA